MRENQSLLIFGLGFSGRAVARLALHAGWQVTATVRSTDKAIAVKAQCPEITCLPLDDDGSLDALATATGQASHILMAAPTAEQSDGHHADPFLSIAERDWFSGDCWLGYLSTTVVYGDWEGRWVTESSETRSQSVRGRRRIAAEAQWSALDAKVHIFRLAGIYGPGRNALETVRDGRARIIDKPGQVFSRIHVDDIAQIVWASMQAPTAISGGPEIYNVCDDYPCEPGEVIRYACQLLGVNPPLSVAFQDAGLSAMGRSFYEDNKRVSNAKAKRLIGGGMLFPTYKEGLNAEFKQLAKED